MLRYALNRMFWFIPTMISIIILTFLILRLTPGTGVIPAGAQQISADTIARLEKQYGLDKPLVQQMGIYIWNAARGDFGESFAYRPQTVSSILSRTFPVSLKLGAFATLFAVTIGMTLGILAAINQNGIIDYISVTLAILFYSLPNFVMGFLLILFFVVWLPDRGLDLGFNIGGLETPKDWVLPMIALGAAPLATIARFTRSSVIESIRSDYVRTARAKGLREQVVVLRHVLKNALIPVITLVGPIFAAVGTGSFFVEKVFNVPGMGPYFVESMVAKDQPMILAVVLIYGLFLAFMNLLVDLLYGVVDPRIRY